jgi:hypothetical protein
MTAVDRRALRPSRSSLRKLIYPSKILACADAYRSDFKPLLERARLAGEGFTIHSLRHTFTTTLAVKGVHSSTAQKMLGHSDNRMTLAIYTRATEGMQDAATASLEEAFFEPAVDTSQKRGFGSSVESLYFSAICSTFSSGGTRIRTGDTMIFSHFRRPIGMRKTRVGKWIFVHEVPSDTSWFCPYC